MASHFQEHRIASAYNVSAPSSSSVPKPVSPGAIDPSASSVHRMQHSIRTGKLDSDGNLVGGEADSASEDERLQDMLELIRRGEIHNIGPNAEGTYSSSPSANQDSSISSSQTRTPASPREETLPYQAKALPPPSMLSKTSKFKASQKASRSYPMDTPSGSSMPLSAARSSSVTPISHERRSSPKSWTPTTPMTLTAEESPVVAASSTAQLHSPNPSSATAGQSLSSSPFSTITDSPPLSPDGSHDVPLMPSMIVESPSFPRSQSSRRPDRPPTVLSTAVKPSRQSPASPPVLGESSSLSEVEQGYIRSNFLPAVMSSVLRESKPSQRIVEPAETIQDLKPKKISRFRAERMS